MMLLVLAIQSRSGQEREIFLEKPEVLLLIHCIPNSVCHTRQNTDGRFHYQVSPPALFVYLLRVLPLMDLPRIWSPRDAAARAKSCRTLVCVVAPPQWAASIEGQAYI